MSRYTFGAFVEGDLLDIRDQIAMDSPVIARRMMLRFVNTFRLLAKHPELGHPREDLLEGPIRFWPVGSWLILYLPSPLPIRIVAVLHGSRDVPAVMNRRAQ